MSTAPWDRAWPAPAKLNLFLHVVGRRADGYHLLQTVFRFINLADTLQFAPRSDGAIVLATPLPGVPAEANLVVRAAQALQEALKVGAGRTADPVAPARRGVTIHLHKRIPTGGGLGGGSSDAATTLLALNQLWHGGLSRQALQRIGLQLGADVPIFIHGQAAFATGIGEQFTAVSTPQAWYVLTMPSVSVPTAEIFRAPELRRDTPTIHPTDWQPGFGHNDLEAVACARFPEVAQHLAVLRNFGDARMTGSGACCFVEFADQAAATRTLAALPVAMKGILVPGLSIHPLDGLT
jgi:4-diphosphocytidyl-2-C-methyl-D-erythritol kinase